MPLDDIILKRGSAEYEKSRRRFINSAVPDRFPHSIIHPRSTEDVAEAIKHAAKLNKHISVRSGGHLFPMQHLQTDEILLDMKGVNPFVEFDPKTRLINFGPGQTVQDLQQWLTPRKLFFPTGHANSVGMGGFLTAGGQGYFNAGWGMTSDRWIVQIEMVTADGEVRICNIKENSDLFWAARGGGMGFFAVVTKFWGRTIPAKTPYWMKYYFNGRDYDEVMDWILTASKLQRPHGTEVFVRSQYKDKGSAGTSDEIVSKEIEISCQINIYADSLEEARDMLCPFDECPIKEYTKMDFRVTNWHELNGTSVLVEGNRLLCDSILNDPAVPRREAIRPIIMDLPSRRSTGFLTPLEAILPGNLAYSLPSEYYIASYVVYSDPKDDKKMQQYLKKVYEVAEKVSVGTYVADFNAEHRMTKVMSDVAWKRFVEIRKKWDPKGLIGSFREKNGQVMNTMQGAKASKL